MLPPRLSHLSHSWFFRVTNYLKMLSPKTGGCFGSLSFLRHCRVSFHSSSTFSCIANGSTTPTSTRSMRNCNNKELSLERTPGSVNTLGSRLRPD